MTDFGEKDGAVAAMRGVANGVSHNLQIYDLSHQITPYDIWEGAYRLFQTSPFWQEGSVFVCVIDPGVGTARKSIVLKTKANHFFVGPNNGLFTLIAEAEGIEQLREIDLKKHRLPKSDSSYTFFGRDVFVFTGAKLASGVINFDEVGIELPISSLNLIKYQKAMFEDGKILGGIPILDVQYGNVWTNIDKKTFKKLDVKVGDKLIAKFYKNNELVSEVIVPYQNTFGEVKVGEDLCYFNSLMNLSFAVNMGDFSKKYSVLSGFEWKIELQKLQK
ncbi:MAG: S-adenosyl-l-methionine hydroxide adenosyltransferase family protein [Spirosomaceae bacterium]|jgi:hypothetical protein|nr:S-adenosyl-l-methionine hydroxide adenosyltransferase family protein [Spirosomataceae bacterium]